MTSWSFEKEVNVSGRIEGATMFPAEREQGMPIHVMDTSFLWQILLMYSWGGPLRNSFHCVCWVYVEITVSLRVKKRLKKTNCDVYQYPFIMFARWDGLRADPVLWLCSRPMRVGILFDIWLWKQLLEHRRAYVEVWQHAEMLRWSEFIPSNLLSTVERCEHSGPKEVSCCATGVISKNKWLH